jgi:hypothetical protein
MRIAWHYATGARAAEILHDGVIKPDLIAAAAGKPAPVWFSLRQHWEPVASEELRGPGGSSVRLSLEESLARGQGAWRFGLPAAELLSWRELSGSAGRGIDREVVRALERAGRKAGSDPALWLVALEPVQLSRCTVEHLHGDHWCSADHGGEHGEHDEHTAGDDSDYHDTDDNDPIDDNDEQSL